MTDETITVRHLHGDVTLPVEQALAVASCLRTLRDAGKAATWHVNRCRCCVTVHEMVPHPSGGYVIGKDGEFEWLEI